MSRTRRLTERDRGEIVRAVAEGIATSVLAKRFGVTARAIQYVVKADKERQADTGVAIAAVTVKLTREELQAFDDVVAAAGVATRTEALRRLIQSAGGTFVPDARLAAEMARYRFALHEVGNGVAQLTKEMGRANRAGQAPAFSEHRLAQLRGLARFILDSADEIDLLLRRRRDAMHLTATAALKAFAHAAE